MIPCTLCGAYNWLDIKQNTLLLRVLTNGQTGARAGISQGVQAFVRKLTTREWKIIKPELIATDLNFRGPSRYLALSHFLSCFIFFIWTGQQSSKFFITSEANHCISLFGRCLETIYFIFSIHNSQLLPFFLFSSSLFSFNLK